VQGIDSRIAEITSRVGVAMRSDWRRVASVERMEPVEGVAVLDK
jgi:hypothetical protein